MADRLRDGRAFALPAILFADGSEDYRAMVKDALLEGPNATDLRTVDDCDELLGYLRRNGAYAGSIAPRPGLIVIAADLPGEPGALDAVRAIRDDRALRRIPIVALGDDAEPATVARAYDAGVSTYILKPVTFLALVKLMKVFAAYWLETAELPPAADAA